MEQRNIIAAISLSAAVILLYTLFFAPPPITKENLAEQNKTEQNSDAPSLDQKENVTEISREDALKESERVLFENQSIVGSISLKGAAIDDLTFKEYNVSLESDEKVKFLSPRSSKEGYVIESGFITTDKNIDIPNAESIWSVFVFSDKFSFVTGGGAKNSEYNIITAADKLMAAIILRVSNFFLLYFFFNWIKPFATS